MAKCSCVVPLRSRGMQSDSAQGSASPDTSIASNSQGMERLLGQSEPILAVDACIRARKSRRNPMNVRSRCSCQIGSFTANILVEKNNDRSKSSGYLARRFSPNSLHGIKNRYVALWPKSLFVVAADTDDFAANLLPRRRFQRICC